MDEKCDIMAVVDQRNISDDLMEEEFNTIVCRAYQRRLLMLFDCWDELLVKRNHWALKDRLIKPNYFERGLVNKMRKFIYNIGQYKDPWKDKGTQRMVGNLEIIISEWNERLNRARWSGETTRDPYSWRIEHKSLQRHKERALKETNYKELRMWMDEWNIDDYFQGPDEGPTIEQLDYEEELVSKNKEVSEGPDKEIDIFIEV